MKKILFTSILFFSILVLSSSTLHATNLRGYIQGYNGYTGLYYPLASVAVDFWYWNANYNQWVVGTTSYTGNDGLYYFFNVIPGYTYYLRVQGKFYPIQVYPQVYQDLPIITL